MANSTTQKIADTAEDTAAAMGAAADKANLETQMAELRKDLARIAETLAGIGAAGGAVLTDAVKAEAEKLRAQGAAAAHGAEIRMDECRAYVRSNPFTALGMAAGAGLLFGMLFGRR